MDIQPPYGDEHKEAPGERYVRLAGEISRFVALFGGPKLNEDATAVILGDILEWAEKLK